MSFLKSGALVVACWVVGACGGRTATPGSTGSSNGTAGSSSGTGNVFGDGMGTGDDPGQSTPANPTGGSPGMLSPGTPTCEQICDRVAQAGCVIKNCVNECNGSVIANPACRAELEKALWCFNMAPIGCDMGGEGAEFFGCNPARDEVSACVSRTTGPSMPGTPVPPPTQPIPSQCIGAAPIPPDGNVCSGGASGGGTGGTGGNAPPTCEAMCTDATGNVWSSYCVGSTCSCLYNGKTYCSCVSAAPCSSCCPGI